MYDTIQVLQTSVLAYELGVEDHVHSTREHQNEKNQGVHDSAFPYTSRLYPPPPAPPPLYDER